MTRKQRRATFIAVSLGILGLAVGLMLFAMRDNIVFFYIAENHKVIWIFWFIR